jgi:hypothetical protein
MWIQSVPHVPIARQVIFKRSKTKVHAYNATQVIFRAQLRNRTAWDVQRDRSLARVLRREQQIARPALQASSRRHQT